MLSFFSGSKKMISFFCYILLFISLILMNIRRLRVSVEHDLGASDAAPKTLDYLFLTG